MVAEPPCSETADRFRPFIGYATCQAAPDCGGSAVADRLRECLGKVANIVDISGTPGRRAAACDVVLAMDCVTYVPEPYFTYPCPERGNSAHTDPAVYERAVGLFAENGRLAQWLSEGMGIPHEKIHVVPPAVAVGQNSAHIQRLRLREVPRRKLLLCVRDFGGSRVSHEALQIVLDALGILQQKNDPKICLTIAGSQNWSIVGSLPDGVAFRDTPLADEKLALFGSHDLLVVPPGPGYGGLPEALSLGIPCVAAQTSEMSDAITPGLTGAVIDDLTAGELAAAIASVLGNDVVYHSCLERAPAMAAYFSWERVVRQIAYVISREVGLLP